MRILTVLLLSVGSLCLQTNAFRELPDERIVTLSPERVTATSARPEESSTLAPETGGSHRAKKAPSKEELEKWAEFRKSELYLPPFEPNVLSLPEKQLEFSRKGAESQIESYKAIMDEAIRTRNQLGASTRLVLKYGIKFIGNFSRFRREEKKLKPRIEASPQFFIMQADLIEKVLTMSDLLRKENLYTRANVNVEQLRVRVSSLLDYALKIVKASPNGGYLMWNETMLFQNEPKNPHFNTPIATEAAHLVTVSRGDLNAKLTRNCKLFWLTHSRSNSERSAITSLCTSRGALWT